MIYIILTYRRLLIVVPRFLEQIRAGGLVTVTHPEVRYYFMLISEAVAQ